jgi:hypothetical protein
MKSLSLSRPLIVFVIGLPGAGKSFFARQFAETFNAPIVSYDYLRFQMFPEPAFSAEEDGLIATIAGNEFGELLKTQRTIIIDGGNNSYERRQELAKLAKKKGYGSLLVWVQTDERSARFRATNRKPNREGDKLNASMTIEAFATAKAAFMAPGKGEDFVVISGKHTYSTQAKVVLRRFVTTQPPAAATTPPVIQTGRSPRNGGDVHAHSRPISIS